MPHDCNPQERENMEARKTETTPDYEKFFQDKGEYFVRLFYFGDKEGVPLEELYQMFKARMEAEREQN